ncbi:unnamed protein product [Amoebophrya sp. A120]|nr:unnamed protein product [Amoebophrya sp. A120]|eukprot:GSA120T00019279001.1
MSSPLSGSVEEPAATNGVACSTGAVETAKVAVNKKKDPEEQVQGELHDLGNRSDAGFQDGEGEGDVENPELDGCGQEDEKQNSNKSTGGVVDDEDEENFEIKELLKDTYDIFSDLRSRCDEEYASVEEGEDETSGPLQPVPLNNTNLKRFDAVSSPLRIIAPSHHLLGEEEVRRYTPQPSTLDTQSTGAPASKSSSKAPVLMNSDVPTSSASGAPTLSELAAQLVNLKQDTKKQEEVYNFHLQHLQDEIGILKQNMASEVTRVEGKLESRIDSVDGEINRVDGEVNRVKKRMDTAEVEIEQLKKDVVAGKEMKRAKKIIREVLVYAKSDLNNSRDDIPDATFQALCSVLDGWANYTRAFSVLQNTVSQLANSTKSTELVRSAALKQLQLAASLLEGPVAQLIKLDEEGGSAQVDLKAIAAAAGGASTTTNSKSGQKKNNYKITSTSSVSQEQDQQTKIKQKNSAGESASADSTTKTSTSTSVIAADPVVSATRRLVPAAALKETASTEAKKTTKISLRSKTSNFLFGSSKNHSSVKGEQTNSSSTSSNNIKEQASNIKPPGRKQNSSSRSPEKGKMNADVISKGGPAFGGGVWHDCIDEEKGADEVVRNTKKISGGTASTDMLERRERMLRMSATSKQETNLYADKILQTHTEFFAPLDDSIDNTAAGTTKINAKTSEIRSSNSASRTAGAAKSSGEEKGKASADDGKNESSSSSSTTSSCNGLGSTTTASNQPPAFSTGVTHENSATAPRGSGDQATGDPAVAPSCLDSTASRDVEDGHAHIKRRITTPVLFHQPQQRGGVDADQIVCSVKKSMTDLTNRFELDVHTNDETTSTTTTLKKRYYNFANLSSAHLASDTADDVEGDTGAEILRPASTERRRSDGRGTTRSCFAAPVPRLNSGAVEEKTLRQNKAQTGSGFVNTVKRLFRSRKNSDGPPDASASASRSRK